MKQKIKDIIALFKSIELELPEDVNETTEEMVSIEVVYEPDTKDAHDQWMSMATVEKACESFNSQLENGGLQSNLFHLTDTDLFTVEKSWIHQELDVTVNDSGELLKAGTWVAKIQYHNEDLWELRKANIIQGVSIGCKANVCEETGEITNVTFDWEDKEGEE